MKDEHILVTGGAGYIGSHIVLALEEAGYIPVILDDLSSGRKELIGGHILVEGDVGEADLVRQTAQKYNIKSVIHMAALVSVPESVQQPKLYHENNVAKTARMLEALKEVGVDNIIFSSSAAVYGQPDVEIIDEDTPLAPINPYGETKAEGEKIMRASGLAHVNLRYFNVAGCDPKGRTGQMNKTRSLIRCAVESLVGLQGPLEIYGTDYETPDGSAVRDYIHVSDLARAHIAALEHLLKGGESLTLNCGYGRGYSVKEVVSAVERVTGRTLDKIESPRRPGDPPRLVARNEKIMAALNWSPAHDNLDGMITTTYEWFEKCCDEASPFYKKTAASA